MFNICKIKIGPILLYLLGNCCLFMASILMHNIAAAIKQVNEAKKMYYKHYI